MSSTTWWCCRKAFCIPGCIRKCAACEMQDLIILQSSVALRPPLEHFVRFWVMYSKNDFNNLDGVEMKSTRMVSYFENITYKDKWKEWGLASSGKEDREENAYFKRQHTESHNQQFFVPTWVVTSNCLIYSKEKQTRWKKKSKQKTFWKNPFNLKSRLDGIGLWRLWNLLHLWFLRAAYTNICRGWPSYPFPASE